MDDLFAREASRIADAPLAERMRPGRLEDVTGQDELLSADGPIGRMLTSGRMRSMVLWGPPGTGKTTMAALLAERFAMPLCRLHASTANTASLKAVLTEAAMHRAAGRRTCLVIDEIHRLSRPMQDQLLEPVETGLVTLVACTTEHVAYEIVDALLSRILVVRLAPHDDASLNALMNRAEQVIGRALPIDDEARGALVAAAGGDARRLLGHVESIMAVPMGRTVGVDDLSAIVGPGTWRSDKDRDLHYDRASAMQKAVRASDPDAALYWFAQMMEAGEDVDFVMRRLLIMANEDVGLADPMALIHCQSACQAYATLGPKAGMPIIAQAVLHLASSPKSGAAGSAYRSARSMVRRTGDRDPNTISINHPTEKIATSRGYVDDRTTHKGFAAQDHWPEGLRRTRLYVPVERGAEAAISRRIEHWNLAREEPRDRRI